MDIVDNSIRETVDLFKKRKISCQEIVRACFERIEKYNLSINAYLTLNKEQALKKAQDVDNNRVKGRELPPLAGIPVALKDIYSTKNLRTTAASKIIDNYLPAYSATVVQKLESVGAIIMGKVNCDAFAHGATGENSDFGSVKNPWDLEYVAGGSSGGSAAAVAFGGCLMAMGTDTGGSIRNPASYCNLVGLKPTYGRVSRSGVISMGSSLDSMGHLTRTVEDCALVLSVTAGYDPLDATSSRKPVDFYLQDLSHPAIKGLKIGLPQEYFGRELNPEIKTLILKAAQQFTDLGAEVDEVSLPNTAYTIPVYYLIMSSEVSANLARFDGIRFGHAREMFGEEAKRRIMLGTFALSTGYYDAYYLRASKVRTLLRQDFEKAFAKFDALLAPVVPIKPRKIGEKEQEKLKLYLEDYVTGPVNLAGLPALALPCGFWHNIPMGMQLIGPQFSEKKLFEVGQAYQDVTDWHLKRPPLVEEMG